MTPRPLRPLSRGEKTPHEFRERNKIRKRGEPGVTCSPPASGQGDHPHRGSLYPPHTRLVAPVAAAPTTARRAAYNIHTHDAGSGYDSLARPEEGGGGFQNMGEEEEVQSLALTPTWVVASVCLVIVAISLAAERLLHRLGKVLKFNGQEALFSALQRVKEELMILGFISFLLSVCQNLINHICIPEKAARIMLPCIADSSKAREDAAKLCRRKGEVPMLSEEALHQLHIFIFVLGVVHVLFCVTTLVLGGAKMRKWNKWEKDIHQGRLKDRENRPGWMKPSSIRWIIAFFKQFYNSVGKSDYQVLRAAFVQRHYPNRPDFDFHKYMVRALEHDFKEVVGISWYLWLFVILFLLLNINGWHTYFWLSFLPLILLLIVGTKLEYISTHLAQEAAECSDEAAGNPWNKPCKEHFWFSNPRAVLHLIHFILFQNSFEMAFFFWVLATYGFDSCIMENKSYALPRLAIGIIVQVLCSYSTLPLYAIVTHMGGDIKLQAFGEHVHVSVHSWATDVKKKSTSMPAHSHSHSHAHAHQHQHPHQHLRIPFLSKKRHSARGADAEEAAAEARAAAQHHAETSGMPTAPPQRNDDLEEIVTTTEEDHRRRNGSYE